jgi:hypothetical protein
MDLHVLQGPENHNRGPATNEHSEHGDTWKEAVDKINANFERLAGFLKGVAEGAEHAAAEAVRTAHERIAKLEAELAALKVPATITDPGHSNPAPAVPPAKES